jgi:predicted RNase H-like nuclease (RuvC/YqgF family)
MSQPEGRRAVEFPKLEALEVAVRRVLRQLEVWRERAQASEADRQRLQEIVDGIGRVSESLDAAQAGAEIDRLREENAHLRRQLEDGRRQAEKLARDVEFLEDAR